MALIEDGIRARILELSAMTTLVPRVVVKTATVDEQDLDADTNFPAVIIKLEGEDRETALNGYGGRVELVATIWCCSKRWELSRRMAEAVRGNQDAQGLEGWNGTAGGIEFYVESIPQRAFRSDPLEDGSQEYWHGVGLVCHIGYSESTYG